MQYYCLSLRDPDNGSVGAGGVIKVLEARGRNQLGYGGRNSSQAKFQGEQVKIKWSRAQETYV